MDKDADHIATICSKLIIRLESIVRHENAEPEWMKKPSEDAIDFLKKIRAQATGRMRVTGYLGAGKAFCEWAPDDVCNLAHELDAVCLKQTDGK